MILIIHKILNQKYNTNFIYKLYNIIEKLFVHRKYEYSNLRNFLIAVWIGLARVSFGNKEEPKWPAHVNWDQFSIVFNFSPKTFITMFAVIKYFEFRYIPFFILKLSIKNFFYDLSNKIT